MNIIKKEFCKVHKIVSASNSCKGLWNLDLYLNFLWKVKSEIATFNFWDSCRDICQVGNIRTSFDKCILEIFSLKYLSKKWKYSDGACRFLIKLVETFVENLLHLSLLCLYNWFLEQSERNYSLHFSYEDTVSMWFNNMCPCDKWESQDDLNSHLISKSMFIQPVEQFLQ